MESLIIAGVLVLIAILIVFSTIKIIPQAQAGIVERLGRYNRTLDPGLTIIIPFVDRLRPLIDLREQVVSFAPQPVITSDNLVVSIDSVIYFQVTDAKAATYEIQSYLQGVEQLTVTTLRNVVGSLDLEETLTSRDNINAQLRGVLDEATGKWGIRVNRVELKAIDPPASVQQSMEKQMRADRDKRAAILSAEGSKQAAILEAEGGRTAAILKAEGQAQAQVLRAQGEAEAIAKVFNAINSGHATDQVMAYQYLQSLPAAGPGDRQQGLRHPGGALRGPGRRQPRVRPGGRWSAARPGAAAAGHTSRGHHRRRPGRGPCPRATSRGPGHRLIPVLDPSTVTDPDDPRVRDFTELTDVAARSVREPAEGLFIAEGAKVILRALAAGYRPRSVLTEPKWLPGLAGALEGTGAEILLASPEVLRSVTGYRVHRGALACFERRPLAPPADAGGRRALRGRPGRPRRPHERRGDLPQRRSPGRRCRPGHAGMRRPALPALGEGVDGRCAGCALDQRRARIRLPTWTGSPRSP